MENWNTAKSKIVPFVRIKGGSQQVDQNYTPETFEGPPTDPPPDHAQQRMPQQHGESFSYYHPQGIPSTPFAPSGPYSPPPPGGYPQHQASPPPQPYSYAQQGSPPTNYPQNPVYSTPHPYPQQSPPPQQQGYPQTHSPPVSNGWNQNQGPAPIQAQFQQDHSSHGSYTTAQYPPSATPQQQPRGYADTSAWVGSNNYSNNEPSPQYDQYASTPRRTATEHWEPPGTGFSLGQRSHTMPPPHECQWGRDS